MTSIALGILNFLMIVGVSYLISYFIMRWSFSAKRNAKLVERYHNMPIAGLNSGAIILLSLGLAFIFSDISTVRSRAKASTLQEADAIRTLGRMSLNIDQTIGVPLMASAREYTASVLEKEWPAMSQGTSDAIRSGVSSALTPLTRMSDIVYSPESIAKLPTVTSMHLANLVSRIREQVHACRHYIVSHFRAFKSVNGNETSKSIYFEFLLIFCHARRRLYCLS